jgi:hypothetical protein
VKAGTFDITNAYEQFGRFVIAEMVVQGSSGPIPAPGYIQTTNVGGIRYPGGS